MGLLLFKIAAFLVALGILVVIHEFGHYWVARRCNVKVLRFSVGFGKPLKTWVRGADKTEWVIAAIPLGGYVKMLDEREAPVAPEELSRAFNRQNVWRRIAIVLAGPVANLLLAIALYWGLFMHGVPGVRPVVGAPVAASASAKAGFVAGDTIRGVAGEPVSTWQDARWVLLKGAVQKALDWGRFTPATVNGKPVRVYLGGTVLFLHQNGEEVMVVSLATHDRDRVGKMANYIQPQLLGGIRHTMEGAISSLTQGILVAGKAEVVVSVDAKGVVTGTSSISENPKGSGLGPLLDGAVRKAQFTSAYENGTPAAGGINVVANFGQF